MDFKFSGWNYQRLGSYDVEKLVKDSVDLGLNLPVTLRYEIGDDKAEMIKLLDKCEKNGLRVLLDDGRANYPKLFRQSPEEFKANVMQAVKDFGSHPAVYGFHIGDEPYGVNGINNNPWEKAATAIKICNECAPNLNNFINLLPFWHDDGDENNDLFYEATGARTPEEYTEVVKNFVAETGIKYIGYDCYSVLSYFEKERYKNVFFTNYRIFENALKGTQTKLYVSLLSAGHMSLKVPSQDDFRYQISTAVASGASGILWFSLYQRYWDYSFRGYPINMWGERTQTFQALSEECRTFLQVFAPQFKDYEYVWSKHVGKSYGGFETFTEDDFFASVKTVIGDSPLIVTRFENSKGEALYTVTNNDFEKPVFVRVEIKRENGIRPWSIWLAPGQLITLK